MEKSAIQWLVEQILKEKGLVDLDIQQAKEMEKQNLYNFYMQGGVDAIFESDRTVEDYYNETFKTN